MRPGNGLLEYDSECRFSGVPIKSNYHLGERVYVAVKVDGVQDELSGAFFARGANRDVYRVNLRRRTDLGTFVMKLGCADLAYNS